MHTLFWEYFHSVRFNHTPLPFVQYIIKLFILIWIWKAPKFWRNMRWVCKHMWVSWTSMSHLRCLICHSFIMHDSYCLMCSSLTQTLRDKLNIMKKCSTCSIARRIKSHHFVGENLSSGQALLCVITAHLILLIETNYIIILSCCCCYDNVAGSRTKAQLLPCYFPDCSVTCEHRVKWV